MAEIPLIRIGSVQAPRQPAPATQGGGIRISLGQAGQAMNQAANAGAAAIGRAPTMPLSLAQNGGQAIADGIAKFSDAVSYIGQKESEAINIKAVADAQIAMEQMAGEFMVGLQNDPDPASWGKKWGEAVGQFESSLPENLSPVARREIGLRLGKFAADQGISIRTSASRKIFGSAAESLSVGIDKATEAGNEAQVSELVTTGVNGGYFSPGQGERMIFEAGKQILAQRRKAAIHTANSLVNKMDFEGAKKQFEDESLFEPEEAADHINRITYQLQSRAAQDAMEAKVLSAPTEALKDLDDPQKTALLRPDAIERLRLAGQTRQGELARDEFTVAKEAIEMGKDIFRSNYIEGLKNLTPFMRFALAEAQAIKQHKASMNDPVRFERLVTGIAAYDPAKDESGLQRAEIGMLIESQFTGSMESGLKAKLDERTKDPRGATVSKEDAFALLDKWAFTEQRFGDYQKDKTGIDGKPVFKKKEGDHYFDPDKGLGLFGKEGDFVKGEDYYEAIKEVDVKKRDAIATKVQAIKGQLESLIASGEITDRADLMKRMTALARATGMKLPAAEAASATSSGPVQPAAGDMGGPNPLLPPAEPNAAKIDPNERFKELLKKAGK